MTKINKLFISCGIIVAAITVGYLGISQTIPKQPGNLVSEKGNTIESLTAMRSSASDMLEYSDLVVVGNVVDTPYEKETNVDASAGTYFAVGLQVPIQIEAIIKGEYHEDTIEPGILVADIINGERFEVQGMKPVNVGDKMVFFIKKTEYKGQPFYSILNSYQGYYKIKGNGEVMTESTNTQDVSSTKIIADEYSPFMNGLTLEDLQKIESSSK